MSLIFVSIIMILTFIYTFYMGYSDGSNSVATCVATRAIKPITAMVIAGVIHLFCPIIVCFCFHYTGVSKTILSLINSQAYEVASQTEGFIFLFSALVGALSWAFISVKINLSSSTSHALMGGIVGAAMAIFGYSQIKWINVYIKIVLMVVLAPLVGMVLSFIVKKFLSYIANYMTRRVKKYFKMAQRINVGLLAFSISLNNVQKSLGVYYLSMMFCGDKIQNANEYEMIVIMVFSLALFFGLFLGGFNLINTVGNKIYKLNTLGSFCAQSTSAAVSIASSFVGIPISIGQVVSSSIVGVGVANKASSVRWITVKKLIISWILTFPMATFVGLILGFVLKLIFLH